jgi:hypothetical protein
MLYFSGMTEDRELWSGWVKALREQGLQEPVAWLIKAGKPAAILLSQLIILASPLILNSSSDRKLASMTRLLEDADQLDDFASALLQNGGEA